MGLLYGHRDPDQTIIISTRCGQDSDCNPSSAAGVLFTTMGADRLPDRYTAELDRDEVFSHTAYSFSKLVEVCEALTRQAVKRAGGRIERTPEGEMLVLPVKDVKPSKLEQCWEPGPVANSRFTDEEREKITAREKE